MNKVHVKTGDTVMVISGKDRGNSGKVLQVSPSEDKVIVEGLNLMTKHVKPRRQGEQGGIVKAEGALYASKVMPVCPKCGKATRVGHVVKDGKKVRVCKKCSAEFYEREFTHYGKIKRNLRQGNCSRSDEEIQLQKRYANSEA